MTKKKAAMGQREPCFHIFPMYIASIYSDFALGNKAGLRTRNVHSSMSYWQQNKILIKKLMDRYAFTESRYNRKSWVLCRRLFFFPARAYICAIIVIREYKKKKKMAICLAWSKQSIKTNHIPSVNTNPGVRYSNIDFNSHNSST